MIGTVGDKLIRPPTQALNDHSHRGGRWQVAVAMDSDSIFYNNALMHQFRLL